MDIPGQPILSCDEARRFEIAHFGEDAAKEWSAMQLAGRGVAEAIVDDLAEAGGSPPKLRILVLAGKGHNGGDALIAAERLLELRPDANVDLALVHGQSSLKPLAQRAWRNLVHKSPHRVQVVNANELGKDYDVSIDGLYGFQFRPPLDERTRSWLRRANAANVGMRASVDLPSGLDDPDGFRADFTYATGVLKLPLLSLPNAGRLRLVDLGFDPSNLYPDCSDWTLSTEILAPLRRLRPSRTDKRAMGHLCVVGGSLFFPGAVLMSVLAAVKSGVGLVTAFVPESLVPAFAARVPEAMWVGWPEAPGGGLALDGLHRFEQGCGRATAVLAGPGLGREPETLAAVQMLVQKNDRPLVLDADALRPEIVSAGSAPRILTPHAGEYDRIAAGKEVRSCASALRATMIMKGPVTRITDGGRVYHSLAGGPVLARGGSGDILAGLVGGLLAQTPRDLLGAACRGVAWQGRAAELLARSSGQVAVRTTELLDHLAAALSR